MQAILKPTLLTHMYFSFYSLASLNLTLLRRNVYNTHMHKLHSKWTWKSSKSCQIQIKTKIEYEM